MRRALLLSVAAHLLAAALLLLGAIVVPGGAPQEAREPATVEMILKAPGEGDAPAESGTGRQAARAAPPPAAPPLTPPQPPPPPEDTAGSLPPPPPPAEQTQPKPLPPGPPMPEFPQAAPADQAEEPAPAVRLGMGGIPGVTNDISGDIPASPDPSAPNLPPLYPSEAARRGEQGAVILSVQVTPDGRAGSVGIASSSGYVALDRAAQQAVARWHFRPELDETGAPVSSRMPIRINFVLN